MNRDAIFSDRKAKEILRDYPDYIGDPEYILRKVSQISLVNDEELPGALLKTYVEDKQALDSAYFAQAYEKITDEYGMAVLCKESCESCGEPFEFNLPFIYGSGSMNLLIFFKTRCR